MKTSNTKTKTRKRATKSAVIDRLSSGLSSATSKVLGDAPHADLSKIEAAGQSLLLAEELLRVAVPSLDGERCHELFLDAWDCRRSYSPIT